MPVPHKIRIIEPQSDQRSIICLYKYLLFEYLDYYFFGEKNNIKKPPKMVTHDYRTKNYRNVACY